MFLIFGFVWAGLSAACKLGGYDDGMWPTLVIANLWFAASLLRTSIPAAQGDGE